MQNQQCDQTGSHSLSGYSTLLGFIPSAPTLPNNTPTPNQTQASEAVPQPQVEVFQTQIVRTSSPGWPQIRDIQEELLLACRQGLNIPQDNIGIPRKGKWSKEEREALLGWLSDGGNYTRVKTKGKQVWVDLAHKKGLFCGTRSWSAIKGQWEDWKKKYEVAKRRVESTGEGLKEEEQWSSMESRRYYYSIPFTVTNDYIAEWLNNQCPNYRWIAEILQKDKSFNAPFVIEIGGSSTRSIVNGIDDGLEPEEIDSISEWESENDSIHPPAGSQKIPLKGKRRRSKEMTGTKAVKKIKKSEEVAIMEEIGQQRLLQEKEKLEYTKRKDEADRNLELEREERIKKENDEDRAMERWKEENRHQEQMRKEEREDRWEARLQEELQMQRQEFALRMRRLEEGANARRQE